MHIRRAVLFTLGCLSIYLVAQHVPLQGASQAPTQRWRYAYVTRVAATAEICYVDTTGCNIKVVTAPPVYMRGDDRIVQESATAGAAMATAVRTLGDESWEMIGQAPAYAHRRDLEALHFKRVE